MSEILLCNQSVNTAMLDKHCGISPDDLNGYGKPDPSVLNPYTPYLASENPSYFDKNVLCRLAPMPVARELTNMSLSFGTDNTLAIADIMARLQEYNIGLMGASTSIYANRMQNFAGSIKDYQAALMEFRDAVKSSSTSKAVAKQKVRTTYARMQRWFHAELAATTRRARAHSRRGTPLTNVQRGMNIARSSRNIAKLDVTSQVQANNLVKLAKHAKFLGNGLAVIDFGSRVGSIHNSYQAGGNWERDMFIESSSFATSAVAGSLTISAGTAALGFMIVATPVGWVGLVIGGIIVAGTAAATSIGINSIVKDNSGSWYDVIMAWISER